MLSPIRQRALARELKQLLDRLPELGKPQSPNSPHQAWSPIGVITPPYVPIPLSPITPVPAVRVEMIPTTKLSLPTTTTYTRNTGDFNMADINITAQQEDKQMSRQEEDEDTYQTGEGLESLHALIRELQEELQAYQSDHNQQFPPKVRMSMNKLMPLHRNGVIEIVFKLAETNTFVELDPKARDAIQCYDA